MNYSSANIQGWQPFSFTLATLLYCHEGFIKTNEILLPFGISSKWVLNVKELRNAAHPQTNDKQCRTYDFCVNV